MSIQGLGAGLAVALVLSGASAAQDFDGSLSAAERRAVAASGLPRAQVVSIKRDLVVAIQSRGVSKGGILFEGVQLRGEAVSAEAGRNLGYRSMRSTVNVDCARRRDMVLRMTIYPEPNGKGEPILRQVPGGWVQPSPSAFMADVIASICSDAPSLPMAAPEPRPPLARTAPPRPTPVAAPPPVRAPEPPPQLAAAEDSETIATAVTARRRLVMPPSEPVPAPPPPQSVVATRSAPPPRPPPRPAPPAAGGFKVQIVAVGTARQAQAALAGLGPLPEPLRTSVETATVDGRIFHRALVTGFTNRADAKVFCEIVVEAGGVCFIR
ncbi:SPOR domain-containing protein [Phenylobacterium sp. LH3H17]|uniref:SPOR domain-containing protein n=1 Tax=Phenylobacterium sp. LH3H17 TaxID=2903901 RepID=UPI0020C94933|nr:SPOR domain-containing protein [Phenylobacterium sp. LH3H17]UTP38724.1 SPOR domain-containing protein [Phenylobacterium sp. LH3H17]